MIEIGPNLKDILIALCLCVGFCFFMWAATRDSINRD